VGHVTRTVYRNIVLVEAWSGGSSIVAASTIEGMSRGRGEVRKLSGREGG
jgi:hypothetical protein